MTLTLAALLVVGTLVVLFVHPRRMRLLEPHDAQVPLTLPAPIGVLRVLRVEPKCAGGVASLIVAVERGRVAPGDILLTPYFNLDDVVVDKTVDGVEALAGADDFGLFRVRVRADEIEVERWAAESLRPDTLVEVFDRAPVT